ncbi:DUF6207 family protein [Streptomyces sp. NPDC059533]|uniref:DUF6207 family protein n=1 Tax=Streptomyces sp. NPDC059533 TaxID=3346858 RepID=UPI003677DE22
MPPANRFAFTAVAAVMKPIDKQHIAEPGLVAWDITGADEDTVRAVMAALEERWATSGFGPVRRVPASLASGPGSMPTSCARDGTGREWKVGKPFVKGLRRVAYGLPRLLGLPQGMRPPAAVAVAAQPIAGRGMRVDGVDGIAQELGEAEHVAAVEGELVALADHDLQRIQE